MKELIGSIIKAEEELQKKADEIAKEAEEIRVSAKNRSIVLEKEMEQNFEKDREKKIAAVYSKVKESEDILKRKSLQEIEDRKNMLNRKKQEIKTRISQAILG